MSILKKYLFVDIFIVIIFGGMLYPVFQKDNLYSEIENKFLTQYPKISMDSLLDGTYMNKFDEYVVDQFPLRMNLISFKNKSMKLLGYSEFKNIYIGKSGNMFEKFILNEKNINNNLEVINKINDYFQIENVGMFIPNSISIYSDELPSHLVTDSQEDTLHFIKNKYNGNFYTPYNVLNKNKDKYIYFKTDHHWTQLGAKLMYEDYYNKTVNIEPQKVTDNFLGTYYSKVLINKNKADIIYAYDEFKNNKIEYDGLKSNTLYDKSKLEGKNKYQYFLNGDPAMAVIEGEGKGEVLIFKDSFAHCYIPFLVNEYSKIHIIDPRYSNINIIDYIELNKSIEKIFYIYSLSTLNSNDVFYKYKNLFS